MELRHLRYFVAVGDELNFTRAANKLHVAQPALSRQIRDLEQELGIKLLSRNHRGVQLTDAGKAFRREAIALLKQSEQAVQIARRSGSAGAGQQNIGYIWGLFHSITPPLLNDYRQRFPETAVHLFDLSPVEQAKALVENKLDAGFIGFAQEADEAHLQKRKVGVSQFFAALPEAHKAARLRTVPLASLADEFFLGISDQTYPAASRYVVEACERAGFRPKFLQMVERGYTILGLVAGKCGVALVPESLKALPHQGVVFRPLADPIIADLFIAWNGKHSEGLVNELLKPLK